ncbi:hypothetical protein LOAG_04915 [Loa loa]|uniref:Uncharacterized protein n=1 Tax=Loa loa TaxID=7209 RepID=A0A1S0U1W3_LOALO|nr:hypothetical protein LOAG_04915 [Loa loa]EFO23565.2 hypothetical protein LOAG_04915 [Loa loa]
MGKALKRNKRCKSVTNQFVKRLFPSALDADDIQTVHKNNVYGDKDAAPTLVMAVSVEKSPAQSFQLHAIPAVVRFIGYRKKRNNAYGDEAISPTTDLTLSKPAPAEQAPTQVGQSYAAVIPDSVESSGYRKKRNNAYGDEAISPTTDLTLSKPAPAEQAPTQTQ